MAINFPDSPSVNQTFEVGNRVWTYNGTAWILTGGAGIPDGGVLDGGAPSTTAQYYTYDGGTP